MVEKFDGNGRPSKLARNASHNLRRSLFFADAHSHGEREFHGVRFPGGAKIRSACRKGQGDIFQYADFKRIANKRKENSQRTRVSNLAKMNGLFFILKGRPAGQCIPYSSSFRYRVLMPIPSSRAASVLLPPVCSSTCRICRLSAAAREKSEPMSLPGWA